MILVHSRLSINHTKHFPKKNLKKRRDKDKKGVTKQVYFQEYFVQRDVGRIGLMVLYSDLSVIFNSVFNVRAVAGDDFDVGAKWEGGYAPEKYG